jgi:hypothetical protein
MLEIPKKMLFETMKDAKKDIMGAKIVDVLVGEN